MVLSAATYFYLLSPGIPATAIPQKAIGLVSESFTLLAIPLFLLAGNLLNACGMTARLVAFAVALVGPHPRGPGPRGGRGQRHHVGHVRLRHGGCGRHRVHHDPGAKKAGFRARTAAALTSSAATLGPDHPAQHRDGGVLEPVGRLGRTAAGGRRPSGPCDGRLPHGRPLPVEGERPGGTRQAVRVAAVVLSDGPRCHPGADHAGHHSGGHVRRRVHADRGRGRRGGLCLPDRRPRLPHPHPSPWCTLSLGIRRGPPARSCSWWRWPTRLLDPDRRSAPA